ncbi:hypothetical protein EB001_06635 [bacterium]|nr:hypothetical protein [bacterium]
MTLYEALKELVEVVEQAIENGDWKVDGACDPDMALFSAKQVLNDNESLFEDFYEHIPESEDSL